ncbi:hypothetical protein A7982_12738 [Minicystis rosea]|nr:hypothetical protein A7982_12738 [Minicystis rosea]
MTTRARTWWLSILSLAGLALSAEARAETGPAASPVSSPQPAEAFRASSTVTPRARSVTGPDSWPAPIKAIFVGVSGGVAYASFRQPEVATSKLVGPMLSFQLGYRITPRWAVSLVYTDFQHTVTRGSGGELFAAGSSLLRAQAECNHCVTPASGGAVTQTTFRLSTLGPTVDVTPFGKNGPFVGVSGGVAMASVTETVYGYAGTARAGLRLRPIDNVSLGVEGGVQGQKFEGGSAAIGYGAAEMRLSF